MPRGQKSKHRAREKRQRRQAQEELTSPPSAQASVERKDDSQGHPESSSAARATRSQQPEGAMAAGATAASYTSSDEESQVEEMLRELHVSTKESEEFVEEKVAILVHYLLYKYQLKEPVTKAEILRNIMQINKNQFFDVLKKATDHLELIFGLDVKEVDPNKNIYVLINKLEIDQDIKTGDVEGIPPTGLLMTILGVILTKDSHATEKEVWEVLNMMGIYDGTQHFFFGDVKMLITKDLVKERYLEYGQVPNSDPPCYEFRWGPRAHAETSKMKVLEFMAKIHNSTPSAFSPYYEEAVKEQEERAKARAAARARTAAMARLRARVNSSSLPSSK
ncbi:melanoma-associated antigen B10-like [Octodon degus]|uniref:Melanoma-associated antigen B10-like n=1 Tax=Octodon degus TaxID=10160 RepID=A0A6P3ETP7_OCTDE|nr:melanoma-associated antigen B10-like [Octodon degus]